MLRPLDRRWGGVMCVRVLHWCLHHQPGGLWTCPEGCRVVFRRELGPGAMMLVARGRGCSGMLYRPYGHTCGAFVAGPRFVRHNSDFEPRPHEGLSSTRRPLSHGRMKMLRTCPQALVLVPRAPDKTPHRECSIRSSPTTSILNMAPRATATVEALLSTCRAGRFGILNCCRGLRLTAT